MRPQAQLHACPKNPKAQREAQPESTPAVKDMGLKGQATPCLTTRKGQTKVAAASQLGSSALSSFVPRLLVEKAFNLRHLSPEQVFDP